VKGFDKAAAGKGWDRTGWAIHAFYGLYFCPFVRQRRERDGLSAKGACRKSCWL